MKKIIASTLAVFSVSFASVTQLEKELHKLYSFHALECAPKEIGKAEAYIETLKGLKIDEDGEPKVVKVSKIDSLIYENKAKIYLSKAEKKIFSDVDNDGKPCYKEVEEGTNPYIPDKTELISQKPSKTTASVEKIQGQNPEKKNQSKYTKQEETHRFKPLKTHARIHFEFDSAKIKKEYLPYLNVISRYLKTHKKLKVKIVGYTDNIGSKSYNDKLALKRAKAVRDYLIKMGVSPGRIEIVGKGKTDYLFDNKTPLNRFTNRRAEFFVMETK